MNRLSPKTSLLYLTLKSSPLLVCYDTHAVNRLNVDASLATEVIDLPEDCGLFLCARVEGATRQIALKLRLAREPQNAITNPQSSLSLSPSLSLSRSAPTSAH